MANEIDFINIGRIMIENQLSSEIVFSWCFWIEFEADNTKALSVNQTNLRERFKRSSWVLQDLVTNWRITRVCNLKCLVNRFVWTTAWEVKVLTWAHFNHWNEWLRSWRERMTNHSDIHAYWWINILIHSIFEFGLLNWTKQSFGHGLTLSKFFLFLFLSFLSKKPLILT